MQEREIELAARQIRTTVVTFEAGFLARIYVEETGLAWPLLIDGKRELYHAYGMLEAGFLEIWSPATLLAYLKELRRGIWPRMSSGDISQRGGDVMIDPRGIIRLHHIGRTPADRPSVDSILRIAG